jgi:hypothetical protein
MRTAHILRNGNLEHAAARFGRAFDRVVSLCIDGEEEENTKMTGKKKREQIITGIVVPEGWDANDNVIRVGIKTSDYRGYVVEHNRLGKELMSLVNKKVRVKGRVRERLDGEFMLNVDSYELIMQEQANQHITEH